MAFETIRSCDAARYAGKEGCILIDLRSEEEYRAGHIPGAVNIPYEELAEQKEHIRKYLLFLYCDRGNTSLLAARDLDQEGFRVVNIGGGILRYRGRIEHS